MIGRKIRRIEPLHHAGHIGMQVRRFDKEDETVGVGEEQTKFVAVFGQ